MPRKETTPPFDKYRYYRQSVQSPKEDVKFIRRVYLDYYKREPRKLTLREDFCGTHAICCDWVKLGPDYQAIGIDLDPETLEYGEKHYVKKLKPQQKQRLTTYNRNVLDTELPRSDIICALNFSYFIFKERSILRDYFARCFQKLKSRGVLVLDCFGGSKCYEENEEETEFEDQDYSYFWDQDSYDPVTNNAMFYIHFKRKGEKKRKRVFIYDWRLWSIPELRDLLSEVGFKHVSIYWEGTTKDGEGNGKFTKVTVGEECESWIAYITAAK